MADRVVAAVTLGHRYGGGLGFLKRQGISGLLLVAGDPSRFLCADINDPSHRLADSVTAHCPCEAGTLVIVPSVSFQVTSFTSSKASFPEIPRSGCGFGCKRWKQAQKPKRSNGFLAECQRLN